MALPPASSGSESGRFVRQKEGLGRQMEDFDPGRCGIMSIPALIASFWLYGLFRAPALLHAATLRSAHESLRPQQIGARSRSGSAGSS